MNVETVQYTHTLTKQDRVGAKTVRQVNMETLVEIEILVVTV